MFQIAVTSKYFQGNREGSMSSTITKISTFITFMVSEKIPMLKFSTNQDTWPTDNILIISLECTRLALFILCMMFLHVRSNHKMLKLQRNLKLLNYRGQESKTANFKFIFLTHLWPWNKVKVIKPRMTMYTPSKVIIILLLWSRRKVNFCFNKCGNVSYPPWIRTD